MEDLQYQERGRGMLVLSRKPGEKILIGDNVTVTIVRIGPNTVRIGIEAPRDMNIVREELCEPAGHVDEQSSGHHDVDDL
jgi:carbon storage regulator